MPRLQTAQHRKSGINISFDPETLAMLDAAAQRAGMTRSALVRRLVREWVETEAEEHALAGIADAVPDDSNTVWIPWEQAEASLREVPEG